MKKRCKFPHPRYSLRGIKYHQNWENFDNFLEWAKANGYQEHLTLDRIDTDGNYEPSNCRWVSRQKQARNTSKNKYITYKGVSRCMAEWAELKNINYRTLTDRIRRGWSPEKAIETPSRSGYERCG